MEKFSTRMEWPADPAQDGGGAEASTMEEDDDDDDEDDANDKDDEESNDIRGWGVEIASIDGCYYHQSKIFLFFYFLLDLYFFCF